MVTNTGGCPVTSDITLGPSVFFVTFRKNCPSCLIQFVFRIHIQFPFFILVCYCIIKFFTYRCLGTKQLTIIRFATLQLSCLHYFLASSTFSGIRRASLCHVFFSHVPMRTILQLSECLKTFVIRVFHNEGGVGTIQVVAICPTVIAWALGWTCLL